MGPFAGTRLALSGTYRNKKHLKYCYNTDFGATNLKSSLTSALIRSMLGDFKSFLALGHQYLANKVRGLTFMAMLPIDCEISSTPLSFFTHRKSWPLLPRRRRSRQDASESKRAAKDPLGSFGSSSSSLIDMAIWRYIGCSLQLM